MEYLASTVPSVAVVTFSRGTDAELLALSTRLIRAHGLTGEKFPRIVVDEKADRLVNPDCDDQMTREFSRGESLDGIECIVGMVQVFHEIAAKFPQCKYLLKMDCDVLMLDTKFLSVLRTGVFDHFGHGVDLRFLDTEGNVQSTLPYCQGAAYALSLNLVRQFPQDGDGIRDLLLDANDLVSGYLSKPRSRGFIWPEDESISSLVRLLARDRRRLGWEDQDASFGHLGTWDYLRHGAEFNNAYFKRQQVYDFLEVGKTSLLRGEEFGEFAARRKASLGIMQNCVGALDLEGRNVPIEPHGIPAENA